MSMIKAPDTSTKSRTGIKVIVVGAGFGGLAAAIECHLQGHDVIVLEAVRELKPLGDIVSFGSNGGRIFGSWSKGYMLKHFLGSLHYYHYFDIRRYDGVKIVKQPPPDRIPDAPTINGHRGEMHMMVYHYAKDSLGIEIRTGSRVDKYFEDEEGAGVELARGERITGHVVIGSDGVRSKAREQVLGYFDKPRSSGYAVFRAHFMAYDMLDDDLTKEFVDYGDTFTGWAGPHVHFLFLSSKGGKEASWFLTHKVRSRIYVLIQDDEDIDESWSFPGKVEDALEVVKDYDPICAALIKKTPPGALIDYKLVYRDPLPTWISQNGRTALLGDAAHPFLPTSVGP